MKVLDHGSVEIVESWGSDERVIESARMSTGGGFVSWEPYEGHPKGDSGLLAYLWRNGHVTPFEMCGFSIEVRAPIFVFREWMRHRTQSYSEASARYAPLPALDYVPTADRCMRKSNLTKQAAGLGDFQLLAGDAEDWLIALRDWQETGEALYQRGLKTGIPKELARLAMSVGRYSTMRASANLRNWLAYLKLRQDESAQFEIRQYANAIADIVSENFPRTYELYACQKQ